MDIETINEGEVEREEEEPLIRHPLASNFSEDPVVFSMLAFRTMLSMSAPLMLSHLTNMLGGFGNVYLFSRLSAKSLASAGLITATQNIFVASLGSSLSGASVLMTEELNQLNQEPRNIGILWRQIQLITFAYDLLMLPLFLTVDTILSNLGQDAALLPHIQNYFNYYGIGFAFNLLNAGNHQILLSHENTLPILLINAVNNLSTFSLGYLLIAKKNNWAESAVSIAYGISTSASLLLCSIYINLKYRQNRLLSFNLGPLTNFRKLLKKGFPIGLQNGAEVIALWISMLMAGKFGNANLTAAEIAGQYVYMLTVPGFALGQVTMILSAQQYTRKNYSELRRVGIRAMFLSQILPLCGMVLFLTIPRQLSQFFLTNNSDADEILQATSRLLVINGVGQVFDSLRQTLTGALIGQEDNVFPMITNMMSMCFFGILSSYLIGFLGHKDIDGIFAGRSICMFLAALVLGIRWFRTTRNFISTPLQQDELTGSSAARVGSINELTDSNESIPEIDSAPSISHANFFKRTSLDQPHSFSDVHAEPTQSTHFFS
ncbi:MAG: MATE family efflux transporter [Candidatus Aquirickettsiella sp.]